MRCHLSALTVETTASRLTDHHHVSQEASLISEAGEGATSAASAVPPSLLKA